MGNENTLVINYNKLGEFKFKKTDIEHVEFGKDKALEVLLKGTSFLSSQKLLTPEERDSFEKLICNSKIDIQKDLGSRTYLHSEYFESTGEILNITLLYDEFVSQYNPEDMITCLLDNLCQIIVKVKYPMDKILEHGKYGNSNYSCYGEHWVNYAKAILPYEKILSCQLSFKALNYFTFKLTKEQITALSEEFGDDLIESLIDDYEVIAMSDFDGENEDNLMTPEEYIGDRMYDYEQEHKNID